MAAAAARRSSRSDRVKILVIINLYPPHALGGYELSCQDVIRRWREHGHDVTILTTSTRIPDVADAADDADAADASVHRDLEWYWADHQIVRPSPRRRLQLERANRRRLDRVLDATRPDVVSVWAMGGMSMSLVSRCVERGEPMVLVIEDDWLVYGPRTDAWTDAWSRRPRLAAVAARITRLPTEPPALPASVSVVFASDYLLQRALADARVAFTHTDVVPLGVDPTDFPIRAPQPRHWRDRLLCVGRIEPRKGFDVAVRALPELPAAKLRIVGPADAAESRALTELAGELGVERRLTFDAVPRDQLAAVYQEADVLIFPSRWQEPFGLVPLEAMTQATPVVATRRGGSAEFLTDGVNCLEIAIDDPAAIVAAVRRLAADPALREQLARGGTETAARYDVGRFADDLEIHHLRAAPAVR
jgi:glycogen(starch) synthase